MKTLIGLTEEVKIIGAHAKRVVARIDTGATRSSIDIGLAKELGIGPLIRTVKVKSATGSSVRDVVKAKIIIAERKINASFNLADRRHMKYRVLVGQNILKRGFLIDTTK
ncbi:MAG: ATP-dependent zinc protease [Candidatus Aenigmarchaeota archaeon]|nr:ATP-dependent zinc protease [Candidatus Aenigmarchaeota archaeon]